MSSYAYGGSAGAPCTENRLTGDHEHHYSSPGVVGLEFARPIPVHVQEAMAARARIAAGHTAALRRRMRDTELVIDHGNPPPYRGDVVPANARKLIDAAEAAGFEVRILRFDDGCEVQGHHAEKRCGFRASWIRGRVDVASWHEPYRYTMIRDTRPIKMNDRDRVGLKGYRTEGMGETRLKLLARPQGMKITHTALFEKVSAL